MSDTYFWLGEDGSRMIYRRCKCGNAQMWESGMGLKPCQGCTQCNTTFATGPEGHQPLQPHKWEPRYDRKTGLPDGTECRMCGKRDFSMAHLKREPSRVCAVGHRKRRIRL